MAPKQPSKSEPGPSGIIEVTDTDDFMINECAKQWGVPKAEALRRLLEAVKQKPQGQEAPPATDKTIKTIQEAAAIGLVTPDPNDIINTMGKGILIKSMGRQLNEEDAVKKKGSFDIDALKELMYMNLLTKMAGGGDNTQSSTVLQEMKAENEKQRQYYEQKLKEQDDKLKDLLFEKKLQTLEDTNTNNINSLTGQLAEIGQRIDSLRVPPANTTPEQAKDTVNELEDLGKRISRIKGALGEIGIIPQNPVTNTLTTGNPGNEVWREKDGSVNKVMYGIDKLTGALEKGLDAWQKKKPDLKLLDDTPATAGPAPAQNMVQPGHVLIQMELTDQEYYNLLTHKPQLNPDEERWFNQNQHRFNIQPYIPPPTDVTDVTKQPEEKKSVIEKIQEQEEEQAKRAKELGM
ncbi:MAG: hypothetical protein PHZ02_01270 [Desulfocapsaceae bacterium]|nr:hypothetical protein [Desulfocapsaceae bacterium]